MSNEISSSISGTVGHADRRWLFNGLGLTVVVMVLAVIFTLINPRFATVANMANVLTQASHIVIIAVAMTFVITSAGIDLSVGSVARGNDHVCVWRCARVLHWCVDSAGQDSSVHCDTCHDGQPARAGFVALGRQHALRIAAVIDVDRAG